MCKFYFLIISCFLGAQVQASSSISSKILEEGTIKAQKMSSKIMDMAGKKSRCAVWVEAQLPSDSFAKMKGFRHCVHTVFANEVVNGVMDSGNTPEACNWMVDYHMSKMVHKKHHFEKNNDAIMSSVKALCGILFPRIKKPL